MRPIPWLVAIVIGSAALGVGCAVFFVFGAGTNPDLEALFLVGIQLALIVFVASTVLLLVAIWCI
jgi:hypothetical protein